MNYFDGSRERKDEKFWRREVLSSDSFVKIMYYLCMHKLPTYQAPRSIELPPLIAASPITLELQETSVSAIIPPSPDDNPDWLAVRGSLGFRGSQLGFHRSRPCDKVSTLAAVAHREAPEARSPIPLTICTYVTTKRLTILVSWDNDLT